MNRTEQAIDFITKCCPHLGAFHGTSVVNDYLTQTASEMKVSRPSTVFLARYIEHVACAVDMVASNSFTSPPAAIASAYLVTRFEFYFRILSGKLNGDGTWISAHTREAAQAAITADLKKKLNKKQISSVALAYKIMKLDSSLKIVQTCTLLDNSLYPSPVPMHGGKFLADIGDRIEFGRHAVGHGHWGDISSEGLFYGLMTAVVFYAQT